MILLLVLASLGSSGQTLDSTHFVVRVETQPFSQQAGQRLLDLLEAAHREVSRKLAPMVSTTGRFDVVVCGDTPSFVRRSGRPWHSGAAAARGRLYTQPWQLMQRYNDLDATLRHELVHLLLDDKLTKVPRWFVEGTAMVLAGDRPPGPLFAGPMSPADLIAVDPMLAHTREREASEEAYRKAFAAVSRIASHLGRDGFRTTLSRVIVQGMEALGPLESLLDVPKTR